MDEPPPHLTPLTGPEILIGVIVLLAFFYVTFCVLTHN